MYNITAYPLTDAAPLVFPAEEMNAADGKLVFTAPEGSNVQVPFLNLSAFGLIAVHDDSKPQPDSVEGYVAVRMWRASTGLEIPSVLAKAAGYDPDNGRPNFDFGDLPNYFVWAQSDFFSTMSVSDINAAPATDEGADADSDDGADDQAA